MWYLSSESDPRFLYVLPSKEITIGRSVDAQLCNFAIADDPSISRKHASLSVSQSNLYLQDLGSRYGTFVNDSTEKMESNLSVKLNDNDVVRLGKMGSTWRVHQVLFVTCTSTLKGENLQNLKLCLGKIGATLKAEWDDSCLYLTMPAITLTIKVVLALAQCAHIVTTEFWNKCLEAVNNNAKLPDPKNYTPQVIESTLNKEKVSFLPLDARKNLFAGKNIIFFSRRQLEMYKGVLTKCSANALLLSETKMTKSTLCNDNAIVIQYNVSNISQETQAQRNQINEIVSYLKSKGKRVVADAEIGLAILYCSNSKYCNPDFNFSSEVLKQTPGQNKNTNILAQESQEANKLCRKTENVVINETYSDNGKRKLSEEGSDTEMKPNKKVATEMASKNSNNESAKRKISDESNGTLNPSKKMALENDDNDMFNFMTNSSGNNDNKKIGTEKKLNFTKPLKRKAEVANQEDDLFNFVEDKSKISKSSAVDSTKHGVFDANNKDEFVMEEISMKREIVDEKVDLKALRGSKLKELMESNLNWNSENIPKLMTVKKEDDLDNKMNNLDLGTTIIKIRCDLIVKKEPIEVESVETDGSQVKNFKKFKKVWPLKMSVISKSASSITIPNTSAGEPSSLSY